MLLLGPCALAAEVRHELSLGGIVRVEKRDPALIGGGNGGTGTSVNYDDGNRRYGRGLAAFAVQGRSLVQTGPDAPLEVRLEGVYFQHFVHARAYNDDNVYLNDAYVGYRGVRLGNQVLRWSDSPSFGASIAPVNPVWLSRRYQPGNAVRDLYVALPMLSATLESEARWQLQAFYQFAFQPSESEVAGTFLASNDFYAPGGRYLQLGGGSPLVPDSDASVITAATPFGSRVARVADRRPRSGGQFGARVETPALGRSKLTLAAYAMRVHGREPIVSLNTGTLGGLQRITAPDYTSSGSYFVEYPPEVTVVGGAARFHPAAATRLSVDYSLRLDQPLQIDDDALITAGLAPAAAVAACAANPGSAACAATLSALNRNPVIAARGGISAANAASFFATEISGYERFDVSQFAVTLAQGLPPVWGAAQGLVAAEVGGVYVHGFRDALLDASVSIRPDASGGRRPGFATRSSWGYRLSARLDYPNVGGLRRLSPSIIWIHDVRGNAPITLGTLLEGSRSFIVAADFALDATLDARLSYREYLGKGGDADRFSDRDFIAFSLTRKF